MNPTQHQQPDLFDRIASVDFEALTVEEQAEFLRNYQLEEYPFIQQALRESTDYFEEQFANLQVNEAIYDDLNDRLNRKPTPFWTGFDQWLNRKVPVYQVCIMLLLVTVGFLFSNRTDLNSSGDHANQFLADSLHNVKVILADSGAHRSHDAERQVVPVQQEHQEMLADSTDHTMSSAPESNSSSTPAEQHSAKFGEGAANSRRGSPNAREIEPNQTQQFAHVTKGIAGDNFIEERMA